MKKKVLLLSLFALIWNSYSFGGATTLASATQTVSMTINSSSILTTSGSPGAMAVIIDAAGVGSATDATTTYTVASNSGASGKLKIAGQITTGGNMPTNTSLSLNLASTTGTSAGAQALSTSLVDLVTGLPTLVSDTGVITYVFSITNGWTVPAASLARTVTLTLVSVS